MDDIGVRSGAPVFIDEIVVGTSACAQEGQSVCVIGRLTDHEVDTCVARLTDPLTKRELTVDTSLIEPFGARLGSLFQMIGELETSNKGGNLGTTAKRGNLVLRTRVVRCVDGLDFTMYKKAISLQRDFLSTRA